MALERWPLGLPQQLAPRADTQTLLKVDAESPLMPMLTAVLLDPLTACVVDEPVYDPLVVP